MARWVVKIGSSLITDNGQGINRASILNWSRQINALIADGNDVVLVSSGAVAEGFIQLGFAERPKHLQDLQAAAAVGQMGLMQAWAEALQSFGLKSAQVLLTHDDLKYRERYLNAKNTLSTLINYRIIPIINENDTVATREIEFGDNDTLGALAVNLTQADYLVILTDQQGLFTADPRNNPEATLISEADANDDTLLAMAGGSVSGLGRGGMTTKIMAARLAAKSGAHTFIVFGQEPDILQRLASGESVGTKLLSQTSKESAKKQWLAAHINVQGFLVLDDGAVEALTKNGSSLLPAGIASVHGDFSSGDVIHCQNARGENIATGIVNFHAASIRKNIAVPKADAQNAARHLANNTSIKHKEVIHRDNLVLL